MSHRTRRSAVVFGGFVAWLGTAALACGPFYVHHRLAPDSDYGVMAPEPTDVERESPAPVTVGATLTSMHAGDMAAVSDNRVAGAARDRLLAQYRQARAEAEKTAETATNGDSGRPGQFNP